MAKQTGMAMNVFVDGYDISGDFQSLGAIGGGCAVIDTTGVDKSAFERIGGRRDGRITAVTHFNPETVAGGGSADRSHLVLRSLPMTDRLVTVALPAAGETWSLVAKQGNYDPTVAADGAITFAVDAMANSYGLEPGKLLTPLGKLTQGAAGNGSSVDFGAGFSFGLQAHLHVFAFTGTSATVKLQQSSDNGGADAFADVTGGAFTAATGRTTQRIETVRNQAVERYLRLVTTGIFTNLVIALAVEVNQSAVAF
jgi:hypothetical protein